GVAREISIVDSTGQAISNLSSGATIVIDYSDQVPNPIPVSDVDELKAGYFDETVGDWVTLDNCTNDTTSYVFTCIDVTHLSKFTIFPVTQSQTAATVTAPASGGGGGGGGGGSVVQPTSTPTPALAPVGGGGGAILPTDQALPPLQAVNPVTQPMDTSVGGLASSGAIQVEVPPQVVSGVASVSLSIQAPTTPFTYPDWGYRGTIVADITMKDPAGNVIQTPDKVVKLTLRYADEDLPLAGGNPNNLLIARFDKDTLTWERLTVTVDTTAKTLTAEVNHFSIFSILAVPSAVITGPAEDTVSFNFAPLLSWTNPPVTTQYQIQVVPFNNDGPGVNLIRNAETSYQVEAPKIGEGNYVLLPGMTYTWRVRTTLATTALGENDPGWSTWVTSTFKSGPTASFFITPVAPAVASTVSSLTPTVVWDNLSKHIFYYEVQISRDPSFGPDAFLYWELRHGGVTVPLNSYTVPSQFPLEPKTTYYWKVRSRVQGDGKPTEWSDRWSFSTP
ncbi:MAG TPA: hypothetical protein VJA25_02265, partial [Dehalococcoidia bacterium]|nr:hypothetical protein [Dehalococcoidia bacterium]